jgi:hypothetical protein
VDFSVELYCTIDNFVKKIEKNNKKSNVGRPAILTRSEYLYLAVWKHLNGCKTNKWLYNFLKIYMKRDFPVLPSYQQFNYGMKNSLPYLVSFLSKIIFNNKQKTDDTYIVDSTPLPICSNGHRYQVTIDNGLATTSKNMNGWYYGFKLHIIINTAMEIVGFKITTANVKDLHALEGAFIEGISGYLIGDKGYIGKAKKDELIKKNIKLITRQRKNMKQLPATFSMLKKVRSRQRVETVFSQLKGHFNLLNHHARSLESFISSAVASVVAYCFKKTMKNQINFDPGLIS